MSAMERLKGQLNQKIAKILGDLQDSKQEPVEDPSPARAGCRIFFIVGLLLGFSLMLVYNLIDAPDARVVQMYHLATGDKNQHFPSCFLYDRNSTSCKKWSKSNFPEGILVSCPCTNTSAPWRNFVKFYVLHENSEVWNMGFTVKSSLTEYPEITVPDDTVRLRNENVVKDTKSLTAERFCNLSSMWPKVVNSTTSAGMVDYEPMKVTNYSDTHVNCIWMATLLFNSSNPSYEDRTRSTGFLNTPSLLNREGLNTLLAQLARESVLSRRLALDMVYIDRGSRDFRRFYNALADMLAGLLDRDLDKMDPSQSYVYGAKDLSLTLSSSLFYDGNALVWYLGDDLGPIFLHPQIDWEKYRQHCHPEYCEVIEPMRGAQKLYWALGILGGVATIVLAIVTTVVWPCTAMLLLCISRRKTTAATTTDPERPRGPLLQDPSM